MSALESSCETRSVKKESRAELYQRLSTPKCRTSGIVKEKKRGKTSANIALALEENSAPCGEDYSREFCTAPNRQLANEFRTNEGWKRLERIELLQNAGLIEKHIVKEISYHIRKDFNLPSPTQDSDEETWGSTKTCEIGKFLKKFDFDFRFIKSNITLCY